MRLLLPWLADFVDVPKNVQALAHTLTLGALEVDGIEHPAAHVDPKAVVAKVTAIRPHPNADRLRLVTVSTGRATHEVVCGAPNVAVGQRVVFLPAGATFLTEKGERRTLTPATIRGVVSAGMVASERELGMSDEHDGILVLDGSAKVGSAVVDALGKDTVIELSVPANRGDCMGVQGIAREVAALTGAKLRSQPARLPARQSKKLPLTVVVKDKDLCPRYSALLLTNVQIVPSPVWMQRRLAAVGIRPINNIVDLTNYLMVETGQPFHAFDYDALQGHRLTVDRLQGEETLKTLDGVDRTLPVGTGVIRDAKRLIDLAGIMGGANSAVSEKTTTVVLQAAVFHPTAIRATSRRLGHRTDAVGYFEKGLDVEGTLPALHRAAAFMKEEWPGVVIDQLIDIRGRKQPARSVRYRPTAADALLGYAIPSARQKAILRALGYTLRGSAATWTVTPPTWRLDVEGEHDVIEDVARVYGYDHVPSSLPQGTPAGYNPKPEREQQRMVQSFLVSCGFSEVINYTFVSAKDIQAVDGKLEQHVRITNPLSEEQQYLRGLLLPGLLRNIKDNLRFRDGVSIFEWGDAFMAGTPAPNEGPMLGLAMAMPNEWRELRGTVDALFALLGIAATFRKVKPPHYADGALEIRVANHALGWLFRVSATTRAAYKVKHDVAVAALHVAELQKVAQPVKKFMQFTHFPPVKRDLALWVKEGVDYAKIEAVLASADPLLVAVELFDLHPRGGEVSYAFHLTFQDPKRTLAAEEVERILSALSKRLSQDVGARIRT